EFRRELDAHLADMMQGLIVRALVRGHIAAAGALTRRLIALGPRLPISRLPVMLVKYCRAKMVPRWLKAGWRRISKAEPPPPYAEIT
ncbi:hypothetical protein Q8G40_29365, partial [Klebsiella pneumoniae]|uniref:hypothetical protein n=1 Tax=Klebsiella pneumoniae TaxID=573 RepID=UPI0030138E95